MPQSKFDKQIKACVRLYKDLDILKTYNIFTQTKATRENNIYMEINNLKRKWKQKHMYGKAYEEMLIRYGIDLDVTFTEYIV